MDALVTTSPGGLDAGGEATMGGAGGAAGPAPGANAEGEGDPFASPDLTVRERAILTYADRLTLEPGSVTEAHLRPLWNAGLDDRAIHDVCAIVAYFAFVNRMADGLGVELEADHREWRDGPPDG